MGYTPNSKIIVALDYVQKKEALSLVNVLDPRLARLKVGLNMFTHLGADWVKLLITKGFDVFLDLKFHDIPQTVFDACYQATQLGVWMINVHAMGGLLMLEKAREGVLAAGVSNPPKLIGVTVLTSLQEDDLKTLNINESVSSHVMRLSGLCAKANLDGVVCSAHEVASLKQEYGKDFICVTPGIRLEANTKDDQKRIMTPRQAVCEGADYLVIGRPITQSHNPNETLIQIAAQLEEL